MEFCARHVAEGILDRQYRSPGCNKQPSFGVEESKNPEFCAGHARSGLSNVYTNGCTQEACQKNTCFGVDGSTAPQFCPGHGKEGMFDAKNKKCRHRGCTKGPCCGMVGGMHELCSQHAKAGMVNVRRKICAREGCETEAHFGKMGGSKEFCSRHAEEGMVNLNCGGGRGGSTVRPYDGDGDRAPGLSGIKRTRMDDEVALGVAAADSSGRSCPRRSGVRKKTSTPVKTEGTDTVKMEVEETVKSRSKSMVEKDWLKEEEEEEEESMKARVDWMAHGKLDTVKAELSFSSPKPRSPQLRYLLTSLKVCVCAPFRGCGTGQQYSSRKQRHLGTTARVLSLSAG